MIKNATTKKGGGGNFYLMFYFLDFFKYFPLLSFNLLITQHANVIQNICTKLFFLEKG